MDIRERFCFAGLNEAEDEDLGDDDAHEHGQRVDRGVGDGGGVVVGDLVGVGQCRRVGIVAAHHADYLKVIHLIFSSRDDAYDQQWNERNQEAVADP